MIRFKLGFLLVFLLTALAAQAAVPRLVSLDRDFGLPGEELVVNGENLDHRSVTKLFLTVGGKDHLVEIKEQDAGSIRFTLPAKIDLGRYNLMIQTGGPNPSLLEQPISCQVVNEEEAKELAALEAEGDQELEVIEPEPELVEGEEGKKKKKKKKK